MSDKKPIPAEIRATVKAWFSCSYHGPHDLLQEPNRAVCAVTYSNIDMSDCGWSLAGEADIILRPMQEQQLIANKVEALRKERGRVLAEAQAKATEIERQINTLLCLTFDQPTEVQL